MCERGLKTDASDARDSLEWHAVDLPGRGDAAHGRRPPDLVVANEYLDALPVHRVVERDGLKEIYVGWRMVGSASSIDEPSDAAPGTTTG